MKKAILFTVMAIGTLLFSACKKEQSEMTMDSIQGRATIQGRVMYDQGALQAEDAMLVGVNMAPAKDVTVMVKVPYNAYKDDSQGNAAYTAKTDANGNYSVSIPVGSKPVEATVDVLPFYASYGVYENGVINTVENVLFNTVVFPSGADVSVDQEDIIVADAEVTANLSEEQPARNKTLKIKGEVSYLGEVQKVDEFDKVTYVKGEVSCPNLPVTLYLSNDSRNEPEIIYNTTTDASGAFVLTASFYNTWDYDFKLEAKVKASYAALGSGNEFKHYVMQASSDQWTIQGLSGVYKAANDLKQVDSSNEFLAVTFNLVQTFEPEDYTIIRGIGNPDVDRDKDGVLLYKVNNPMGWSWQ